VSKGWALTLFIVKLGVQQKKKFKAIFRMTGTTGTGFRLKVDNSVFNGGLMLHPSAYILFINKKGITYKN